MIFHWCQWKWQTHFSLLQEMSLLSLASFCQSRTDWISRKRVGQTDSAARGDSKSIMGMTSQDSSNMRSLVLWTGRPSMSTYTSSDTDKLSWCLSTEGSRACAHGHWIHLWHYATRYVEQELLLYIYVKLLHKMNYHVYKHRSVWIYELTDRYITLALYTYYR